jgi:archaemetzincin
MPPKRKLKDDGADASIPFAKGFKRPSRLEQIKAAGFASEATTPVEYHGFPEFFSPIPDPSHIDDWLAQDTESRESYAAWLKFWNENHRRKAAEGRTVVYLQPIGPFTNDAVFSLDGLASFVKTYYPATVVQLLEPLNIEATAEQRSLTVVRLVSRGDRAPRPTRVPLDWRRSHAYDSHALSAAQLAKGQYGVMPLLRALHVCKPADAFCIIGVTMEDLYDGAEDSFTVGMANGGSGEAIFSFARYDPAFGATAKLSSAKPKRGPAAAQSAENARLLLFMRSCKVLVHELGHLYGIDHCVWYDCCMNGSGHLAEDYRQALHFCPVCLRKLQHVTGCDLVQRYRAGYLALLYDGFAMRSYRTNFHVRWLSGVAV